MVILLVWFVGILAVLAMKKIQPNNKIYPLWVAFVCVVFTLFVISYVLAKKE